LLDEVGQYEQALDYYNKALALDPRNAIVWNNKGNALCKLGRSEEAIECYDKALTVNQ